MQCIEDEIYLWTYWAWNYYLLWVAWNWVKKIAFSCLLWVNKTQINYPISHNPWEVIFPAQYSEGCDKIGGRRSVKPLDDVLEYRFRGTFSRSLANVSIWWCSIDWANMIISLLRIMQMRACLLPACLRASRALVEWLWLELEEAWFLINPRSLLFHIARHYCWIPHSQS